jgi:hypothetical protein
MTKSASISRRNLIASGSLAVAAACLWDRGHCGQALLGEQ